MERSKWIYFASWWMVGILLLMSCSKEDGYVYKESFNIGKQAFDDAENNMAVFMSFFDLSLRVNACSVADMEGKDVEERYLPDYDLVEISRGEWIGIKEGDTLFRVVTDGLALTTETAVWKVYGYDEDFQGEAIITCSRLGEWNVQGIALDNKEWVSDGLFKIQYKGERAPENFGDSDWAVSGTGVSKAVHDEENEILHFEVAESLIKISDSKYLFDKGILFLRVKDGIRQKEETIKAELRPQADASRLLQVTYKEKVYSYADDTESGTKTGID